MHTRPGLGSYLSEVVRFALDMRKRFTVPTDCRYIDARVAESVTTARTSSSRRPHHRAHAIELHALVPRSPPEHRDDGSVGPSTDISRSRTVPNNVGNTGSVLRHWSASARGVAVTGISI